LRILNISESAEGVFVFIANSQRFFINSPKRPVFEGPYNAHNFGDAEAAGLLPIDVLGL
jgi:hypothetical protein